MDSSSVIIAILTLLLAILFLLIVFSNSKMN